MKQFEEFEKTLDCPATGTLPCSVAENTWRAALNWLYGKLDYSTEHEELKDIIEEELQ